MSAPTLPAGLDVRAATAFLFSSEARAEAFSLATVEDLCAIVCAEYDRCYGNPEQALADMRRELTEYPETAARHYNDCVIAASRITGVTV